MSDIAETIVNLQADITRLQQRVEQLEQENCALREQIQRLTSSTPPTDMKFTIEQLQRVIQHMPVMLTAFDDTGTLIVWNKEAERITGYRAEEMLGNPRVMELIQPDSATRTRLIQEWATRGNYFRHWELDLITRDGTSKTLAWSNIARDAPIPGWSNWGIAIDVTERRQAEQRLHETQQMLRLVMDHLPQAIFWKDRQLIYLGANRQFMQDAGVDSPEAVIGKTDFDMPWIEQAEFYRADDRQVMETRTPKYNYEEPIQKAGGVPRWLRTNKVPLRDRSGTVVGVLGIYEDISESKQRELELQIFKALVEHAPDAIAVTNMKGHLTYINPAWYHQFGITELNAELGITQFVPADQRPQHLQQMVRTSMEEGSWRGEVTFQAQTGRTFPGEMVSFAIRNTNAQPIAIGIIIRDSSERKQMEDDLRDSEARNRALLTGVPDLIFRVNSAGLFLDYKPAVSTDFYVPPEAFLGKTVVEVLPPDVSHLIMQANAQALASGVIQTVTYTLPFPDELSFFEARIVPYGTDEVITLVRNITAQVRATEERDALQQQVFDAQQAALRDLLTPLIPIADNVVIMPLIGSIDSKRAQMILETLLEGVAHHQADVAILDITGVNVVDTQVAQALVRAAQAVRLLGARVMLTGIHPQIAQTLVHLGADLSGIHTYGNLQSGIAAALKG